jgi:hypothetical protein
MTETTVTAAARRYAIPARPPGITSHPDLITRLDNSIPSDIRRAVEGQLHGWQRLRRFQQVIAYPSLNIAAAHIDAHPSTLISQFHRLERDVGGQLVHRATSTTQMRPTARGGALLKALSQPEVQALVQRHGTPPRRGGQTPAEEKARSMRNRTANPMRKPNAKPRFSGAIGQL